MGAARREPSRDDCVDAQRLEVTTVVRGSANLPAASTARINPGITLTISLSAGNAKFSGARDLGPLFHGEAACGTEAEAVVEEARDLEQGERDEHALDLAADAERLDLLQVEIEACVDPGRDVLVARERDVAFASLPSRLQTVLHAPACRDLNVTGLDEA